MKKIFSKQTGICKQKHGGMKGNNKSGSVNTIFLFTDLFTSFVYR